jgi:hypothetical protein
LHDLIVLLKTNIADLLSSIIKTFKDSLHNVNTVNSDILGSCKAIITNVFTMILSIIVMIKLVFKLILVLIIARFFSKL